MGLIKNRISKLLNETSTEESQAVIDLPLPPDSLPPTLPHPSYLTEVIEDSDKETDSEEVDPSNESTVVEQKPVDNSVVEDIKDSKVVEETPITNSVEEHVNKETDVPVEETVANEVSSDENTLMNVSKSSVMKGWLIKQGGSGISKNWRKRWFVLSGTTMYYFKSNTKENSAPTGSFDLTNYNTVEYLPKKSKFTVVIRSTSEQVRTFTLICEDESSMNQWIVAIKPFLQTRENAEGEIVMESIVGIEGVVEKKEIIVEEEKEIIVGNNQETIVDSESPKDTSDESNKKEKQVVPESFESAPSNAEVQETQPTKDEESILKVIESLVDESKETIGNEKEQNVVTEDPVAECVQSVEQVDTKSLIKNFELLKEQTTNVKEVKTIELKTSEDNVKPLPNITVTIPSDLAAPLSPTSQSSPMSPGSGYKVSNLSTKWAELDALMKNLPKMKKEELPLVYDTLKMVYWMMLKERPILEN